MEKQHPLGYTRNGHGRKILFANVPADGHFNPLTGLAVHLRNIGYDVRWYTGDTFEQKINKLGISTYRFKRAFGGRSCADLENMFPGREQHKSQVSKLNFDLINIFIARAPEYYEDIREIYQTFPFDLMIADVTFGAIPLVKEKMNIPVLAIGVVPLMTTSRDLGPAGLGLTPATGFFGRRKQDLMRLFADHIIFARSNKEMRKVYREYDIETGNSNVFDSLSRKATLLLQSGTPGFEFTRSDFPQNVRFLGPLLPYIAPRKSDPWHHEKLERYKKVILVTQGTVEKDIDKLIVPTLQAFTNSDHLVIVTTGGSRTAELQQRFRAPNVVIEDFIPFDDVMPYCDVYVTNGGYGGTLMGIKHQLPLVVAGVHEGKLEINARVGYFNLGINLRTEKPTPQQIKESVEAVFANNIYKENVVKLGSEFNQYDPSVLCAGYIAELLHAKSKIPASGKSATADKMLTSRS